MTAEFTSNKKNSNKTIIIGSGSAAFNAAKAIRQRTHEMNIVMYGDEASLAYHRPMLTKALLMGKSVDVMLMKQPKWYEEQNITVHTSTKVTSIDPANKTIQLADGTSDQYDYLVIATGATSFIPPMTGSTLSGVYAIRQYHDMKQIEDHIAGVSDVVVIGGGVLGLEAAWQFHKKGIHVTILELAPKLMGRQLDDMTSDRVFELIQSHGMDVQIGVQIEAITGNDHVTGVQLKDGTMIKADMVIMSTGIRADVSLAKDAGISINKAIVVNQCCETNIPGIYAAGDCAEYEGINYGLWPEAQKMGEVAGANIAGDAMKYQTIQAEVLFHGMDTQMYALGDVGKDSTKQYDIQHMTFANGSYGNYYFVNDVFSGAVLFGDIKDMKRVSTAYQNKATKSELFPNS